MSNILGIHLYNNKNDDTSKLIAVHHNAPMIYNTGTDGWNKAPIHLTSNTKCELVTFLDHLFLVNGTDYNYSYNNTNWSTSTNLSESVKGKYIWQYNVRLYLANITIAGTAYPSRVWYSNLPNADGTLTWGIVSGSDLVQTADSDVITSASAKFKTQKIDVGDPITITTGSNAGEYTVKSIDSETQITLTESLTNSATGSSYWVGGNYFDVETDDGDELQGLGSVAGEMYVTKAISAHRYSSSGTLRKIEDSLGTTSNRSIIMLGGYTYKYHPSEGISRTEGTTSILVSSAIEDILEGMSSSNYTEVVGWVEENKRACFYIGDVTLRDGDTISDCVVVFDTVTSTWSTRSYPHVIKCATTGMESNALVTYFGDDSDAVYKFGTDRSFNTVDIPFTFETHPIFPAGSSAVVTFKRFRICSEDFSDGQVAFKLVYKPTKDSLQWETDKDWQPLKGSIRGGRSEFAFPLSSRASGIMLKYIESSSDKTPLIEKGELYYSTVGNL